MSDKYCCCTWETLGVELADAKLAEIEALIADKGLPKSVFASVFKVLDKLQNYCPVCGSNLSGCVEAPIVPSLLPVATPIVHKAPEPTTRRAKCPKCNGRKSFGKDDQGIVIRCMHCHGMGFVDQRHVIREAKSQEEIDAENRIEEFEKGEGE
jgi:RNA polymerase subunit RPABC4/transcription elongation factor Spt4